MAINDAVTGYDSTPDTADDVAARNRAVFASLSAMLNEAGLGALFTTGADGAPGGWLWNQVTSGIDSEAALAVALEATPEFQARYPVISEMRARAAKGEPVRVPSVADVRTYEVTVANTLQNAGLPSWFYDDYRDTQALMSQDLSAVEVEQRLGQAWERVRSTDPAVVAVFKDFFGVEGDAAMAAMFLDPTKTISQLDRASMTAYTAGMGRTMGLNINRQLAEKMATLPKTEGGIVQDLQQVSSMMTAGGVFDEGITETVDLTTDTGIEAVSLGSGQAQADIRRRIAERSANDRSSTGGAALTQRGFTGIGSS